MSYLEKYQAFVRKNGKDITGIDVPVVLSDEENKQSALTFKFGWSVNIGVSKQNRGGYCPSGEHYVFCGSGQSASDRAHAKAKTYLRGENALFNNRMKECLCSDVARNFLLADQDLRSAPSEYVGQDTCYSCRGSGTNACYSCHGSGKSSCSSCGGSGQREVQRYSHSRERTVYSTESCSSCWGSGTKSCGTCGGSGNVTCSTCSGGGYLYCTYSIDGSATRVTDWSYENTDHHAWSDAFINSQGLSIIHSLTDVTEVAADEPLGGCTFYYAMKAVLPTLQFKADVEGGSTYIKFAGRNQITYDAGGVYDPVVWSLGKQLGSGDQQTDTKMLAVPAIKSIVESHETKSGLDLVKQNWVSTDIQDAVVANYQELVKQLKKSTQKGLIPQMFIGFFRNTYLLLMYACFVAILIPEFAGDIRERFNFSNYMTLINVTNQGHFADPWLSRALALLYFFLIYKAVGKFYWKRIITFKKIVITSIVCFAIPFAIFTTYTAMINVMRYDFYLENLLLGGSIGGSIYFFFWAFAKPKKWYIKPLAAVGALALILALQYVLMFLNGPIDIEAMKNGNIPYIKQVGIMLQPAYKYVFMNIFEVFWMTLLFTYFATRRRFWLNTKNKVARYNSPVLFKSMKIDSEV